MSLQAETSLFILSQILFYTIPAQSYRRDAFLSSGDVAGLASTNIALVTVETTIIVESKLVANHGIKKCFGNKDTVCKIFFYTNCRSIEKP